KRTLRRYTWQRELPARPSRLSRSTCIENLREPGSRDPRRARFREGINVDAREAVVIKNPLAYCDMPVGIGIVEQSVAVDQQKRVNTGSQPEPGRESQAGVCGCE